MLLYLTKIVLSPKSTFLFIFITTMAPLWLLLHIGVHTAPNNLQDLSSFTPWGGVLRRLFSMPRLCLHSLIWSQDISHLLFFLVMRIPDLYTQIPTNLLYRIAQSLYLHLSECKFFTFSSPMQSFVSSFFVPKIIFRWKYQQWIVYSVPISYFFALNISA